jgi:hypothetical protein
MFEGKFMRSRFMFLNFVQRTGEIVQWRAVLANN